MDPESDLPSDDEVLEDLIDLRELEYADRLFVVARIAPHPTAIRSVFEVSDEGEPVPRSPSDLVAGSPDPYFWVEQYGLMLHEYVREVHRRLDSITTADTAPDVDGPLGQAFEPVSEVGRAARQSAAGVRAHVAMFTEVLFYASSHEGWPEDAEDCARLLDLFVDANLAASVLEQLGGQPAIPDDVLTAWDPNQQSD